MAKLGDMECWACYCHLCDSEKPGGFAPVLPTKPWSVVGFLYQFWTYAWVCREHRAPCLFLDKMLRSAGKQIWKAPGCFQNARKHEALEFRFYSRCMWLHGFLLFHDKTIVLRCGIRSLLFPKRLHALAIAESRFRSTWKHAFSKPHAANGILRGRLAEKARPHSLQVAHCVLKKGTSAERLYIFS